MIGRKPQRTEEETSNLKGFDDYALSLGDVMRGERATIGKSLLDVQRELRIKANYIVAIENADPSVFDTPGFIAGYVRSYSRYLGLDPDWAFEKFCEESGFAGVHGMQPEASSTKLSEAPAAKPKKSRKAVAEDPLLASARTLTPVQEPFFASMNPGALGSLIVLVGLIAGLGYGGWSILQQIQRVTMVPVESEPGVVATVDPLAPAVRDTDAPKIAELTAPTTEALDRLYRPAALDVPVLASRDGPIATIDPNATGLWRAPPTPPEPQVAEIDPATVFGPIAPVQVTAPPPPEVALVAVNPAWVRVRSADGTILLEKVLERGETFVLPASEEPAILRAGNSGSVYFLVDGEAFGPAGASGTVASNVALSRDSLQTAYALADLATDPRTAEIIAVAEANLGDGEGPEVAE
ncbi:helix-turn-helix domain-containing protein [Tropicimonas sp. S265A]|uniref:helix-turn-helix domain-containing protein n=1 Tax=Tropicimonas sp. S265A TaxID=3415134 RepID=UPI003C7C78C9